MGSYFPVRAQDDNTAKIATSLKLLGSLGEKYTEEDGIKVYPVETGAVVNGYAKFEVSGTDVNEKNVTVKIWLPKQSDYIKSVTFSGSYNASKVVFSGDDDPNEFSVSYLFKNFNGGLKGGYPFYFKFENIITPSGIRQPIYFSIYKEDGTLLFERQEEIQVESVAYTQYESNKYVWNPDNSVKSFRQRLADYIVEEKPTMTPEDPQVTKNTFYNVFTPIGNNSGLDQAEFRARRFKVIDTIPEGAVFLENDSTNINYGWTAVEGSNGRQYQAILDKDSENPTIRSIFTSSRFMVPIVLGFPNQEYTSDIAENGRTGISTSAFVNTSQFYYYAQNDEGDLKEYVVDSPLPNRQAELKIYTYEYKDLTGNTDFRWNKYIVDGKNNFVNFSNHPDEITVSNGNTIQGEGSILPFVRVYPDKNDERPAWRTSTDIWQYTKSNYQVNGAPYLGDHIQRILDTNQNNRMQSTGYTDSGEWATSRMSMNSVRMYYRDFMMTAEILDSKKPDADSTLNDLLENTKFWVFKTFHSQTNTGGFYYATDSEGQTLSEYPYKPTVLVPITDHPIGFNEFVKINDEGGYYTGLLVLATKTISREEAAAIRAQQVVDPDLVLNSDNTLKGMEGNSGPDNSILLKNVRIKELLSYGPVKDGAISVKENGELYRAPAKHDLFKRFSQDVIRAKNERGNSDAKSVKYVFGLFATIPASSIDNSRPSLIAADNIQDFQADTHYVFRPNTAAMRLKTSGDASYTYTDSAPIHHATFEGILTDVRDPIEAKNLQGIILLPSGVEYVSTENFGTSIDEPEIVDNYKNTGKQAIVYKFGNVNANRDQVVSTGVISYTVRLTNRTKDSATSRPPESVVETWLSWENDEAIWADQFESNGVGTPDKYDLNENGNYTTDLLKATYNLFYYSPAELTLRKYVTTDTDLDHLKDAYWSQTSPFQDVGADVVFKILLINQYSKTVTDLSVIDRLPAIDDYKIAPNEDGEYFKRGPIDHQTGSAFPVHLKDGVKLGQITDSQGELINGKFNFDYTISPIIQNSKDIVASESEWIAEGELDQYLASHGKNYQDITAIRAVLKDGEKILGISEDSLPPEGVDKESYYENNPQIGNTATIYIPSTIPYDNTLPRDLIAYNSAAYKEAKPNTDLYKYDLLEGNEVSVRNMYYTVSGTVFRDRKHNGALTGDRFENIKAILKFAEDTTIEGVTYPANTIVPSRFVRLGKYDAKRKEVVPLPIDINTETNVTTTDKEGKYYFVVYKRGKYYVTFEANPAEETQTFVQYGSATGVERSNTTAPAPTSFPVATRTTETNSMIFELSPENLGYLSDNTINYMGTKLHQIRNAAIDDQKADVVVFKYGVGQASQNSTEGKPLSATFTLTSKTNQETLEQTTDPVNGLARFEDMVYGNYILTETRAPEGVVAVKPIEIMVGPNGIDFGETDDRNMYSYFNDRIEVKNIVPKGSITISKVSAANSEIKLSDVVFGLYQNGEPVVDQDKNPITATTNRDGLATFTELVTGTHYVIKELQAKTGYTTTWVKSDTEEVDLSMDGVDVYLPIVENANVSLVLNNRPYESSIKVRKIDVSTPEKRPMESVKFGLFDSAGENPILNQSGQPIVAITNESGLAVFEKVTTGDYVVKEIETKSGYLLDTKNYKVKVIADDFTYWVPRLGAAVENRLIKGNIAFTKVDENDQPMPNVEFELYQGAEENGEWNKTGEALQRAVSSANGSVTFQDLTVGDYVVKETVTKQGYELSSALLHARIETDNVTVTPDGLENGHLVNRKIIGSVYFIKVDQDAQEKGQIIPLKNVEFKIYKAKLDNDQYIKDGDALQTKISGEDGKITFADLEYGDYLIEETNPAPGYLTTDTLYHVQIHTSGPQTISEDGYFPNKIISGTIKVKKVDQNGQPIANVTFSLLQNDIAKYTAKTDENGIANFIDVIYGKYELKETEAPSKYVRSELKKEVQIEINDQVVDLTNDSDAFVNEEIFGNIQILKKDSRKGLNGEDIHLAGAKFKLFYVTKDENNMDILGDPVMKDGNEWEVMTNDKGEAEFGHIPYGTYFIKEIEAPQGYVLNNQQEKVWIDTQGKEVHVLYTNDKITGSLKIQKLDKETKKPLANAKFKLYDRIMDEAGEYHIGDPIVLDGVVYEVLTDENGEAILDNIPYGTYFVKEIDAPDGYLLDDTPIKVEIVSDQQQDMRLFNQLKPVEKTDPNKDQKEPVHVVNTADTSHLAVWLLVMVLMITTISVTIFYKKNREN